ncbi:hypothetical protein GCM10022258_34360 [Aquimarina gracilis]
MLRTSCKLAPAGDDVRLATPLNKVKPGSYLEKEVRHLFKNGYKVSKDGKWLRKQ